MVTPDSNTPHEVRKVTARELLEKFHGGHTEDVERILRFASEHHLENDDMVFLLTAILKGNENLVLLLLKALIAAEQTLLNFDLRTKRLMMHTKQVMIGQIEEATSRATGRLNTAADRVSGTIKIAEELSVQLACSSQDVRSARDTLQRMIELPEGTAAVDRLWIRVGAEAREYLRMHGDAVVDEIRTRVRGSLWFRHGYALAQLILTVWIIAWLVRH